MITPHRNQGPPYVLPSNIVYFHDWRYVQHGNVGWRPIEQRKYDFWTTKQLPPMGYQPHALPRGIAIKAMPARKSEPFLSPAMTDELYLFGGTVMHDEGRYRLWFDCWPIDHLKHPAFEMGLYNFVRYAESDNGVDWTFPKLGLIE